MKITKQITEPITPQDMQCLQRIRLSTGGEFVVTSIQHSVGVGFPGDTVTSVMLRRPEADTRKQAVDAVHLAKAGVTFELVRELTFGLPAEAGWYLTGEGAEAELWELENSSNFPHPARRFTSRSRSFKAVEVAEVAPDLAGVEFVRLTPEEDLAALRREEAKRIMDRLEKRILGSLPASYFGDARRRVELAVDTERRVVDPPVGLAFVVPGSTTRTGVFGIDFATNVAGVYPRGFDLGSVL
ncbi:hypothetical protein [Pseudoclavibacter helvolus]|uniref:Uncharacterized protein n=1 Tax=Pseudoclavibacter helvolus TaxID=255205 RepID=A0A7W4UM49_9MICO|nr:hypothetical protein [Pseudoclavibacter helvolus]MBB2956991.1 hypothetical protein [Pseudoclavibacter helvolus]